MKKYLSNYFLVGLSVPVLALVVFFLFLNKNPEGIIQKKLYGEVKKQDLIQRVTIAGTISPSRKSIITAPYNGYVKKLFVKIGDVVKQGDPLVAVAQSLQSGDGNFPLRSPFNGTVVQVERSEGEFVRENDSKDFILRIDDTDKLFVVANTSEIDRVKIKKGQEAVIKVSAIPEKTYKGVIRELSLAARDKEQWSRSQVSDFPVKIEITDKDDQIKPGMSAVMDVITAKKENVLMLRHEFIRREAEKYYVLLSSGRRKDIQVGLQNEEGFEILSGLEAGDKIKQIDFTETQPE